nr:MAG TPA: hypothetical protein [Herelleviridae sp.]
MVLCSESQPLQDSIFKSQQPVASFISQCYSFAVDSFRSDSLRAEISVSCRADAILAYHSPSRLE